MHWDMPDFPGMGPMYVDRAGNEIQAMRWTELRQDRGYQILRKTPAAGVLEVSTVWLGLNSQFMDGPPIMFETMVFEIAESNSPWGFRFHEARDQWTSRYSSERQALEGHEAIVRDVRSLFLPVRRA